MSTEPWATPAPEQPANRQTHFLPFKVSVVTTESEIARAVATRSSAYLRHNAPAADLLRLPEEEDSRSDVVLLVARSKLDDGVLGTIRLQSNFTQAMKFEESVRLSPRFDGARCVEFMRLGVRNGPSGRLVTSALAKASFQICVASGIDYIFIASRPPVDQIYRGYKFDDLLNGEKVDLSCAPGAKHTVLCLPVAEAEARWRAASNSVYRFFVESEHPDIAIDYAEVRRRFPRQVAEAAA